MPGPGIPTITWGTFADKHGIAHVAPQINQVLMSGHNLTYQCFCGPMIDAGPHHHIVIHYVVH